MSSILLLQSDPAASAAVFQALKGDASFAVYGIVDTLSQARAAIERRVPDLLIADLRVADGMLVDLLQDLRPRRSHVLVRSASLRDPWLLDSLRHGADAYVSHGEPDEVLCGLVRRVLGSESPLAPEIARPMLELLDSHGVRLTQTERRLVEEVGAGLTLVEAAAMLELTPQQAGLLARAVYRRLQLDAPARARPGTGGFNLAAVGCR